MAKPYATDPRRSSKRSPSGMTAGVLLVVFGVALPSRPHVGDCVDCVTESKTQRLR